MDLAVVWFILWAVLWTVYFMLDGFDLGVGMLYNFISDDEKNKKLMLSSIGPFWDGNEVWLITAGGATFAAFPNAYAYMFSWLYTPLFLILIALIARGISVELRNKFENRKIVDTFIFLGSFLPALLFGVAFGNFYRGLPIDSTGYNGGVIGLLNISGIITGLLFVIMFAIHGLLWLDYKIDSEINIKIHSLVKKLYYILGILFVAFFVFMPFKNNINFDTKGIEFYLMIIFYLLSLLFYILLYITLDKAKSFASFILSMLFIMSFIFGGFAGMYPNILASNISKDYSVTIFNASSSPYTLKIMTAVAVIFVPIVIFYQLWVYRQFKGKITSDFEGGY